VVLRCQVRIEPAKRAYTAEEKARLLDLFGTPDRWGQTLRPLLWTHASLALPAFTGRIDADLPVPCTADLLLAGSKYFDALGGGDVPLLFLFSGTVFHEDEEGILRAAPISWEKESGFRLPAATWRRLMDMYYPNGAWLILRRDVLDRLARYKSRQGLPTWEHAMERLLTAAEEHVAP
jgi:hypothetical protein